MQSVGTGMVAESEWEVRNGKWDQSEMRGRDAGSEMALDGEVIGRQARALPQSQPAIRLSTRHETHTKQGELNTRASWSDLEVRRPT